MRGVDVRQVYPKGLYPKYAWAKYADELRPRETEFPVPEWGSVSVFEYRALIDVGIIKLDKREQSNIKITVYSPEDEYPASDFGGSSSDSFMSSSGFSQDSLN